MVPKNEPEPVCCAETKEVAEIPTPSKTPRMEASTPEETKGRKRPSSSPANTVSLKKRSLLGLVRFYFPFVITVHFFQHFSLKSSTQTTEGTGSGRDVIYYMYPTVTHSSLWLCEHYPDISRDVNISGDVWKIFLTIYCSLPFLRLPWVVYQVLNIM
jgi:hypothetical protein